MTTAYLFPGQGSQVVSMGRISSSRSRRAADLFDAASAALGRDMRRLCWESSLEELTRTENLQPALTLASLADWVADERFERKKGNAYSGHSIGALGAAVVAGAIDPIDGIVLASRRGALMASAPGGGAMAAVVTPRSQTDEQRHYAESLARTYDLDVAAYNGPTQVVLAGSAAHVDRLVGDHRGKCRRLNVSNAFHSRFMRSVKDAWAKNLERTPVSAGPGYVGSCTGEPARNAEDIRADLREALTLPVQWRRVMGSTRHCENLEIYGPSRVIARLARPYSEGRTIVSHDRSGGGE